MKAIDEPGLAPGLVPWGGASGFRPPAPAWRWMAAGGALTAVQSFLISGSIGWSHVATGVYVVYTLRRLWAIALVWAAGHRLGNDERAQAGPGVLARRWVGARECRASLSATWRAG